MNKKYVVICALVCVAIVGLFAIRRMRAVAFDDEVSVTSGPYTIADYIAERGQPQITTGTLDLSQAGITDLYGLDRVQGIAQVVRLNLSHNHINDIPQEMFPAGLRELFLADNNITSLSDGIFPTGLQELVLSDNNINYISGGAFPAGLQELNLSGNQIHGTQEILDVFAQLGNITIYLLNNPITREMTQQQFQNQLPNLQVGSW